MGSGKKRIEGRPEDRCDSKVQGEGGDGEQKNCSGSRCGEIIGKRRLLCFFVKELLVIGIHFDQNVVNS